MEGAAALPSARDREGDGNVDLPAVYILRQPHVDVAITDAHQATCAFGVQLRQEHTLWIQGVRVPMGIESNCFRRAQRVSRVLVRPDPVGMPEEGVSSAVLCALLNKIST